jgi:glycine cleavage system aminomethyltransferase T
MLESTLRTSVARTKPASAYFRLSGPDVFDVVDRLVTSDLYLQEAQLRQSLLLDAEGFVAADAIVGRDDEAYILVLDGLRGEAASKLVSAHVQGTATKVEDLSAAFEPIGLHGPYAWELVGEWLGPDLVGLPYLTLFRHDGALVLRTGRTGEYGYDVLMPRDAAGALIAKLEKIGTIFDLGPIDAAGLDLAALENGFFNLGREGRIVRDPLELQLKWRLSKEKTYRGSDAVSARWNAGATKRVTWWVSETAIATGDPIELDGQRIGTVVNVDRSEVRKCHIGIASIDLAYAHAGIDAFEAPNQAKIETVAPPLVNNLSLYVSPQRHSYRDRASYAFPPL